jgi:hypothetical protein
MVLTGKVVDTHALLQTVWVGLTAGVGLAGAYGLAMLGTYRAADAREDGRPAAMVLYGVVGALGVLIVAGGLGGGLLVVMGEGK